MEAGEILAISVHLPCNGFCNKKRIINDTYWLTERHNLGGGLNLRATGIFPFLSTCKFYLPKPAVGSPLVIRWFPLRSTLGCLRMSQTARNQRLLLSRPLSNHYYIS
ncbi:Uncharacterized protein HZ326_19858 [Fusarium oxysporum f. sp. albedinis]|nr:Uncharacterized protein HZ326_26582 [Fusarium oxysporum f. sp. albedinis]KAJ0137146.1 Uncharacterized protein HZ326_19858 [Fusarium oxysporum f. sp. albedinis]